MSSLLIQSATKYSYQFGCPIFILIGTVGCILNLGVFLQKKLRKNPCSIYFIAFNIANFINIYSSFLATTLSVGYNIDASIYNVITCHVRLYVTTVSNILSPTYLILASIDRIAVTSRNVHTRRRSTRRSAYVCIICYFRPGFHTTFGTYYSLTKGILILLLMTITGLWSIKNIRSTTRRVIPSVNQTTNRTIGVNSSHSSSSKDRQLISMLLMDIIICILFSFAFAIFLLYQQITQNSIKTFQQIQIETSIRNLCIFSSGVPFCISCYSNLIVSKTFRKEVKKIFRK